MTAVNGGDGQPVADTTDMLVAVALMLEVSCVCGTLVA
jgi:hypothetical protein